MPAFGKVHSAASNGYDRVKSGLRWAGHKYQQGMHLAAKTNDLYQTGKKIAGMFMPALDRHGMTGAAAAIGQGFGAMDALRDRGIQRHQDVISKLHENADILANIRKVPSMVNPYLA